jgi:hypothetical protein
MAFEQNITRDISAFIMKIKCSQVHAIKLFIENFFSFIAYSVIVEIFSAVP